MLNNSARTALDKPADNPYSSPAVPKSGRARWVAQRAALEASAQAALARSAENKAKRKLGYGNPPPGSSESPTSQIKLRGEEAEHKSRDVLPPGGPFGSPAAEAGGDAQGRQRIAALEADLASVKARMSEMQFSVEGLSTDMSSFQLSQEAATGKILALLQSQGSGGLREQDKQFSSQVSAPPSRLEELRRLRRDGKLQVTEGEFEALCNSLGKTSAKVSIPLLPRNPLVVGSGAGFSSQGFGSSFEDFPTTTDGTAFSSVRMDEQRARVANKTTMTKAFASESAFHEYCVSRGFLDRAHASFPFFSTLVFQTRELVLRDNTWATSKAYLTRLWTVQANEGRSWLELVGKTSAKRYVESILPEFSSYIDSVKFTLLREEFDKASKKKLKDKNKDKKGKYPGSAKKTKEHDFFCEFHNSWFAEAEHKDKCRKQGKARPGDRNGP
jgi:hypothetical protein